MIPIFCFIEITILGVRKYWCTSSDISYNSQLWEKFDGLFPSVVQRSDSGVSNAGLAIPNTGYALGRAVISMGFRKVFEGDPIKIYDCYGLTGGVPDNVQLVFSGYANQVSGINEFVYLNCIGEDSATSFVPAQLITRRDFKYLIEPGTVFAWNNENYTFEAPP